MPTGRIAVVVLMLSLICGCGRPGSDANDNASGSGEAQKLPFDREPRANGVSPSQLLLPSATKLPEGTPIPIRLLNALSSATARPGDTSSATVDEAVVIDGQTLVGRGAPATGQVLDAKSSGSWFAGSFEPGYLRIVLVSLTVGGKVVPIETSSIFAKGGSREERNPATGGASGASEKDRERDKDKEIVFGTDRRLNFRLAQTVDLR